MTSSVLVSDFWLLSLPYLSLLFLHAKSAPLTRFQSALQIPPPSATSTAALSPSSLHTSYSTLLRAPSSHPISILKNVTLHLLLRRIYQIVLEIVNSTLISP